MLRLGCVKRPRGTPSRCSCERPPAPRFRDRDPSLGRVEPTTSRTTVPVGPTQRCGAPAPGDPRASAHLPRAAATSVARPLSCPFYAIGVPCSSAGGDARRSSIWRVETGALVPRWGRRCWGSDTQVYTAPTSQTENGLTCVHAAASVRERPVDLLPDYRREGRLPEKGRRCVVSFMVSFRFLRPSLS